MLSAHQQRILFISLTWISVKFAFFILKCLFLLLFRNNDSLLKLISSNFRLFILQFLCLFVTLLLKEKYLVSGLYSVYVHMQHSWFTLLITLCLNVYTTAKSFLYTTHIIIFIRRKQKYVVYQNKKKLNEVKMEWHTWTWESRSQKNWY